jgi:DNA-binding HxlR family transcriptional regulator
MAPALQVTKTVAPAVPFEYCPISESLDCFGKKWALQILRDVAFLGNPTFGQILRRNDGLTPRALSIQLRSLIREGAVRRVSDPADRRRVRYTLSRQGKDAVPILAALLQYGMRYHAHRVFVDGRRRGIETVYPGHQNFLLGRLASYASVAESGHGITRYRNLTIRIRRRSRTARRSRDAPSENQD